MIKITSDTVKSIEHNLTDVVKQIKEAFRINVLCTWQLNSTEKKQIKYLPLKRTEENQVTVTDIMQRLEERELSDQAYRIAKQTILELLKVETKVKNLLNLGITEINNMQLHLREVALQEIDRTKEVTKTVDRIEKHGKSLLELQGELEEWKRKSEEADKQRKETEAGTALKDLTG